MKCSLKCQPAGRKGFTLIELLVVIAIIHVVFADGSVRRDLNSGEFSYTITQLIFWYLGHKSDRQAINAMEL